jgi:hypothetical protein
MVRHSVSCGSAPVRPCQRAMMVRLPRLKILSTWGLIAVISACDTPNDPTGLRSSTEGSFSPRSLSRPATLDDEFERVAREEVPGFAGHYLDDEGRSVVLLADAAQRTAAERYVAAYRAKVGRVAGRPLMKTVRYDFIQLKRWRDLVIPFMRGDGVFTLDIDEVDNRVTFGVRDTVIAAELRRAILAAGVPQDAVALEVQAAPEFRQHLQGYYRPNHPGFQVRNASGKTCTLTVLAGGTNQHLTTVFYTASHCTATYLGEDYLAEYQPTISEPAIGWEYFDMPPYWCPQYNMNCRYSDAAMFGANGIPEQYAWGRIARPTNYAIGQRGSLLVDTANPFVIASNLSNHEVVGWWMDKVGRTSGWTRGQVEQTCVIIGQLVCQYIGSIWSEGGDSGSPIFYVDVSGPNPGSGSNINFSGILWGGPVGDFTTTYWSTAAGIRQDFGGLTVCTGPSCTDQ